MPARLSSISTAPPSSAIAPALTVFPTAVERDFAARAIVARVTGKGPLTHVGALTIGQRRPRPTCGRIAVSPR